MAKRRKRTNKTVPAKGRLRDMADQLWSLAVRDDWAWKCAVCGIQTGKLEAHHVHPRGWERFRYTLRNGILLCFQCHNHNNDYAPHQNAAGWMLWLREHHPEIAYWYISNTETCEHHKFEGTKNPQYYIDQICRLSEYVDYDDFERVVGKRFSLWLAENSD